MVNSRHDSRSGGCVPLRRKVFKHKKPGIKFSVRFGPRNILEDKMGNVPSPVLAQILKDAQDIETQIQSLVVNQPTNFGPASFQGSVGASTPFGVIGPYKTTFKNLADGTVLTLTLQSQLTGLTIGDPYTFSYVQNSPVAGLDTISNLQAITQSYSGFLVPFVVNKDGSVSLTFLSPTGLPPLTLNVASVPSGLSSGQMYNVVYVLAGVTGAKYDELKSATIVAPTS